MLRTTLINVAADSSLLGRFIKRKAFPGVEVNPPSSYKSHQPRLLGLGEIVELLFATKLVCSFGDIYVWHCAFFSATWMLSGSCCLSGIKMEGDHASDSRVPS